MIARFPQCASSLTQAAESPSTSEHARVPAGRGRTARRPVYSALGSGSFDPDPVLMKASKATLLSVDRPGYGRSDPRAAADHGRIGSRRYRGLDNVGVEQVGVAGWSAAAASRSRSPPAAPISSTASPSSLRRRPTTRSWIDPSQREAERLGL